MQQKSKHIKFTASLLAFLMFFSSIGFSMDVHYCMGDIESIAFFGNKATCDMMEVSTNHCSKEKKSSHCSKMSKKKKMDCCRNEKYSLEKIEIAPKALFNHFVAQKITFLTFFVVEKFQIVNQETLFSDYQNYKPPLLLNTELIIDYQVFLI